MQKVRALLALCSGSREKETRRAVAEVATFIFTHTPDPTSSGDEAQKGGHSLWDGKVSEMVEKSRAETQNECPR